MLTACGLMLSGSTTCRARVGKKRGGETSQENSFLIRWSNPFSLSLVPVVDLWRYPILVVRIVGFAFWDWF